MILKPTREIPEQAQ